MIDGCAIFPTKNLKILGILFDETLDWNPQVEKIIKSCNSLNYALRSLNKYLSRSQFRRIIHAFFISRITYGCQIWSGCLSYSAKKRLESCFYKALRMQVRDFRGELSRITLVNMSGIMSLRSIFILRDTCLLHRLCTSGLCDSLGSLLMAQCHFSVRKPNSLYFFDYSKRKVAKNSFINRAKFIAELIPFEWSHLGQKTFISLMKRMVPKFLHL